jgi:hypothetical protein
MKSRKQLLLLLFVFILSVFVWYIPFAGLILYPFKLFATYVHEFGHAFMAIITGGGVKSLSVNPDGSGLTTTYGGSRFLIASGGYLGSSLIGGLLLILAVDSNKYLAKVTLAGILLIMLGCLIFFVRDFFTLIATLLFLGIGGFIVVKMNNTVNQWFLGFLAIQSCFYSVYNINVLFGLSIRGHEFNDAIAMQKLTMIPAPIWAILWLLLSFIVFGLVLVFIYKFSGNAESPRVEKY